MEYQEILDYVSTLDFAGDPHVADSMVRAVLGDLCSSVEPAAAEHLAEHLPEPLTVGSLCCTPPGGKTPSFNDYVQQIRGQFGLSDDEAFELIDHVVRVTREAVGQYAWDRFVEHLPVEVGDAIRKP